MKHKERRKNRFDRLVLLLLAAVAIVPIAHAVRAHNTPKTEEVTLILRANALPHEVADALCASTTLQIDGLFSLSLIHAERAPATLVFRNSDGTETTARSSAREDVTVTLRGSGTFCEDGFLLAAHRPLSPGMSLPLCGRDLNLQALLLRIEHNGEKQQF